MASRPTTPRVAPRDRSSSRSSFRSSSPSEDPVQVRTHISTLKHSIRHQQAQLQSLENIIRAGPRPLHMPPDDAPAPAPATPATPVKILRRSSYDVLQSIAGPASSLPLPKRDHDTTDILEGIPMTSFRRPSSPTRSLSRIPVSAVGNARALADEGLTSPVRPSSSIHRSHSSNDLSSTTPTIHSTAPTDSSSLIPPSPTPNSNSLTPTSARRLSSTPGGTTKVLADLQTGVINARNALENTKSQLRLSQRTVASLTRKVEDLKEVEERLRIENEGLNNVVARKERLLQEVLERARKAEAEAALLKSQLKQETSTSKKSIREMESQLAESTALSKKSEREYITLRDSIKGMTETWKHDTEGLKSEMKKRDERWKKELDGVGKKYKDLVQNVKEKEKLWGDEFKKVRENDIKMQKDVDEIWTAEIKRLEEEVKKSDSRCEKASATANDLALELSILRKRMRAPQTSTINDDTSVPPNTTDLPSNTTAATQENIPP
ncbi:hypothetical protein AGABI1DRAFT_69955 [Agaricus bisporus var. burnettii JB137-S8]|uniref:SWI5-dependent HO expression protein 3 n=1 Tax=Agaricus bisporus var. burnettii (strain JB137-S8 / ATCC MYA-4627 / FGSC 10392) TaxID=597362 RepID=K5Y1F5_AGABU|nr:uncharacterized protein AGABI1DRAFT_69955 [Agaricus bisporus var. burnettii JB137-S8]EKM81625.1 hypothetical protein AGABI1DRAFT_69955 [Agaricus bisporus var. burnettii JB137-S8]